MKLNEKGQCPPCKRKPLLYKRAHGPNDPINGFHFCFSCDRAYSRSTGEQIENWAWKKGENGEWIEKHPKGDGKR